MHCELHTRLTADNFTNKLDDGRGRTCWLTPGRPCSGKVVQPHRRSFTLQQQPLLKGHLSACLSGALCPALLLVLVGLASFGVAVFFEPGVCQAAGDDANGRTLAQAQQNKAQELLDIAEAHIDRHEYSSASGALEQCAGLAKYMSSGQKRGMAKYSKQAAAGALGLEQSNAAMAAGTGHLQAGRIAQAQRAFEQAHGLRRYLPKSTVKKIAEQLAVVKVLKAQRKKELKTLFKRSVQHYRKGELLEAQQGFAEIERSEIPLGFFDRGGNPTTTQGYLTKIAESGVLSAPALLL